MIRTFLRSGLTLILLTGACARMMALEPEKWSRLNNLSKKDYVLAITDWKVVVGNIYIKKEGETGDGMKLSAAKATAVLSAGTNYLCFFEATAGSFAISFAISAGDDITEFNLKRAPKVGDRLVVSPRNTLTESPVSVNFAGFRRVDADPFLTIN